MAPEGPAGEERETLRTLLDSLRLRLALSERPERYFRYGKDEVGGDTERHPSFETPKAEGETLEEIAAEAARCSLCPLHATRTSVVFGGSWRKNHNRQRIHRKTRTQKFQKR